MSQVNRGLPIAFAILVIAGCSDSPSTTGPSNLGGDGGTGGALGGGGSGGMAGMGGVGGAGGAACENSLPTDDETPMLLSQTGLYADISTKTLPSSVSLFEPRFALWSDGADKARWVYVPECGVIDSSDIDDWSLPVGTRLWKEFALNGVRIETRLIERFGEGANDFLYATYAWNDAETDATLVVDGVVDAKGTTHNIPPENQCRQCHGPHEDGGGRPSRALGFTAVQLADAAALSLADLVLADKLDPPPSTTSFTVPGATSAIRDALGYVHANCGNCHNKTSDRVPQVDLDLWLDFDVTDVARTGAYLTAVGVPNAVFNVPMVPARITPGQPTASSMWFRMNERGNNAQMPPVGSEISDPVGLTILSDWIGELP